MRQMDRILIWALVVGVWSLVALQMTSTTIPVTSMSKINIVPLPCLPLLLLEKKFRKEFLYFCSDVIDWVNAIYTETIFAPTRHAIPWVPSSPTIMINPARSL